MYAIVETGGKQYRVQEGDVLQVELLEAEPETTVAFDRVLGVAKDGQFKVGRPVVEGAKVHATVLEHGLARKIIVFKYKAKSNYRKKTGHRQGYTKVRIDRIEA